MNCARCGNSTSGTYNEGGVLTAVCPDCEAKEQREKQIPFNVEDFECLMCGAVMDKRGKFCSEECGNEYRYQNRTCESCGGEFWDGGTSCTCEDEDDPDDEDSIFGYECLGCQHVQDHPGPCDMCTGSAVDPMYE